MSSFDNHTQLVKPRVGRPSKYNRKLVRRAYEYITDYSKLGHAIPTKAGLCLYLGIGKDTVNRWSKESDKTEFKVALEQLEALQEASLVSNGLTGDFNSAITKLCLASNHGYSEQPKDPTLSATININKFMDTGVTIEGSATRESLPKRP